MISRTAVPGLAAGALGLAAGLFALVLDAPALGAVAGVLALAAGFAGLRTAQQLHEQGAVQRLVEEELRSVRAQAKVAEAEHRKELELSRSPVEEFVEDDGYYEDEPHDPLTDESTGLFSESFFSVALDSRVAAARRHLRPVAVVLLEVVEGLPADEPQVAEAMVVADAVRATLREADTACRLRNGDFAILLEDTPENGAIWTVERIRRHLAEDRPNLTLWAGVACYPAHAFSPGELMAAAETALTSAREWRQDRIEVALVASD
ncbi:MAG: GGDEF domain-containing protein [Acidimicrobiales bacterium]